MSASLHSHDLIRIGDDPRLDRRLTAGSQLVERTV